MKEKSSRYWRKASTYRGASGTNLQQKQIPRQLNKKMKTFIIKIKILIRPKATFSLKMNKNKRSIGRSSAKASGRVSLAPTKQPLSLAADRALAKLPS